jgi:hypothetical protein
MLNYVISPPSNVFNRPPTVRASRKRPPPHDDGTPAATTADHHEKCKESGHRSHGKQQQTCRDCTAAAFDPSLPSPDRFLAVRAVSKSYFCAFCLHDAVAAGPIDPCSLQITRSCEAHRGYWMIKKCPCNRKWSNCLDCMVKGVDPRAGTAFCHRCHCRHGARGSARCRCDEPAMRPEDYYAMSFLNIEPEPCETDHN